jgi:hypothetical protein
MESAVEKIGFFRGRFGRKLGGFKLRTYSNSLM